jgi:hypothetical protein
VWIAYDKLVEPVETIQFSLYEPTGAILRGRQTAVMNVSDPAPHLFLQPNSNLAVAMNAELFILDPFKRTTANLFGEHRPVGAVVARPDQPTRIALMVRFVDLVLGEEFSAVTVRGIDSNQVTHELPVEFVGPLQVNDLSQVNIGLPAGLPAGDLYISVTLRGRTSALGRIRIQ